MTTESSVRFVGDTGARNWSRANEVVIPSSARDLELLLKGQKFHGSRRDAAPSRSGSAPPSMEGSLYALANFDKPDESSLDGRLSNINSFELQESEDQLRADPAYIAYYLSNINLNPRLPPPLISRENRHLARQIGRWGVNQALHSFDDSNKGYLMSCQAPLSTHEEGVEEDSSPTADSGACYLSGRYLYSKEGQYKSRVDLIQEDNPQAPSPIHSDQFPLSSHGLREVIHSDAHVNPQQDLSKKKTKSLELGIYAGDSTKHVRSDETIRNNDLSASYLPSTSSHESERIFYRHIEPKRGSNMERDKLATDGTGSIVGKITTGTRNISILNEQKNYHPRKNLQHISSHSRSSAAQCHASSSNMIPQSLETQYLQNDIDQFSDRQSKLPLPIDINPRLQMNGYSVPVYGGAANYMNLGNFFYPDVQQSSLFSPHYSIGGYAVNASIVPSLFTGYASPGAIVTVERPVNVTGGNVALGVDWQQMYKYGHLGVPVRPSVLDPSYYPYLQQPFFNAFEAFSQYDPLMHNYDLQKAPLEASSSPHQMPHQRNSVNIHNQMKGAISSPSYYASPQNLATPLQCPSSSFITSSIQGSPVVGTTLPVMRNEDIILPVASHRKAESYPGWHGQRGRERIDDPKTYSLLDELKSGKARRFEFSDMIGRILEFSTDQHGSRFIQQKLEHCNDKEKKHMFEEVLPHASTLMTDVFGNYVIQKFFEHGNTEQRKELANKLVGRVLSLSLQMHGCRVVQKAFEVVENDQKTELVKELDGNIMRCVRDQNGNHVIQKCIECVPTERIGFIISFFQGQVATLSTHLYGCRVIQRVLEHCTDELQSQSIIDEVLQSACFLAQDQYGNYVIQHVLERGRPQERSQIISKLAGQIVNLSQNKFASNVIEKCLEHGDSVERELLIEEMVGQTEGNENLLVMMKDQYANYVIQKILDICDAKQQEILVNRIKVHLPGLKKYTYGKHIVTRVEKLSSEDHSTPAQCRKVKEVDDLMIGELATEALVNGGLFYLEIVLHQVRVEYGFDGFGFVLFCHACYKEVTLLQTDFVMLWQQLETSRACLCKDSPSGEVLPSKWILSSGLNLSRMAAITKWFVLRRLFAKVVDMMYKLYTYKD